MSSPPSEAQQLLVLAGDEVDGGVLQQGREDKEQADGHPDVDGLYVGHLRREKGGHGQGGVGLILLIQTLQVTVRRISI